MLTLGSKTKKMAIVHCEFEFYELLEIFLVNQILKAWRILLACHTPNGIWGKAVCSHEQTCILEVDYEAKLSALMNRLAFLKNSAAICFTNELSTGKSWKITKIKMQQNDIEGVFFVLI